MNPRLAPSLYPLTKYTLSLAKCVIPCKNGGRCIGNNLCRCPNGLRGDHCEIGRKQRSTCKCSHGGICLGNKGCKCQHGYQGRHCRRRKCPKGKFLQISLNHCLYLSLSVSLQAFQIIAGIERLCTYMSHVIYTTYTHTRTRTNTEKNKHKQEEQ